ncbi:MAG: hypothetical protein P4M04_02615 [Acidobacteriota bacterium]|nr:hypothetical protein [Acidobacteriota bacterium]
MQDWWLQAKDLEGPWTYAKKLPDDMKKAEEFVVTQAAGQTLQTDPTSTQPSLKEAGKKAEIPVVYVEFGPAELIETKGEPVYKAIPGTGLEYAENTNGNIFRLGAQYYILISGRWFRGIACHLRNRICDQRLFGLGSAGHRRVTRSEAKLTVQYGGEATFVPIEGTSMTYAKNTSAAVIKVSDNNYCVEAGV